jgi:hypothetical protein
VIGRLDNRPYRSRPTLLTLTFAPHCTATRPTTRPTNAPRRFLKLVPLSKPFNLSSSTPTCDYMSKARRAVTIRHAIVYICHGDQRTDFGEPDSYYSLGQAEY